MKLRNLLLGAAGLAIGVTGVTEAKQAYAADLFFPVMVYRTGAYAPSGIPIANAARDYFELLNKRDGGIEGHKVVTEECETKYNTKIGVECYEKLKNKHGGALVVSPYSTGLTYQLIPKAPVDKAVIFRWAMAARQQPMAACSLGCSTSRPPTGAKRRLSSLM